MDWNDLSIATRPSEKLRFNKLCEVLSNLDDRIEVLEQASVFNVTITLAEDYTNPTVKFDGDVVTKTGNNYVISNVSTGNHTIKVECSGYETYEETVACSVRNNNFTVTLVDPHFNVYLSLAEDYSNPTVKFDGNTVTQTSSKYIVENVLPGEHLVGCTCNGYQDFSMNVNFSRYGAEYTITLTPL